MSRVLGVVRLSREREESTSVERQRKVIQDWADRNNHDVIGWAEDVDVSGAISPWDRPALGPWLNGREADFDILAGWKIDRLSRRLLDVVRLVEWCEERRKRVVGIDDAMDSGTPTGRAFIGILAVFAETERENIRARTKASFDHLMRSGRWRGGWVPFGYVPVKNGAGAGWALAIDSEASAILYDIVRNVLNGESVNGECRRLNDAGVPSPLDWQRLRNGQNAKGGTWRPSNLKRLLTSHTLLGWAEMTETDESGRQVTRVVRGSDGMPLQRAEPLLSRAEFDRLQVALKAREFKRSGEKFDPALLLRVAYCECGSPLYRVRSTRGRMYYRCGKRATSGASCGNRAIACETLDREVTKVFLTMVGGLEIKRREFVKGTDNAEEIAEIERALAELREDRAMGLYRGEKGAAEYRAMYSRLEARREALSAQPVIADSWQFIGTGERYAERFAGLSDTAERNLELRRSGLRVVLHREPQQTPSLLPGLEPMVGSRAAVLLPPDLAERVMAEAQPRLIVGRV